MSGSGYGQPRGPPMGTPPYVQQGAFQLAPPRGEGGKGLLRPGMGDWGSDNWGGGSGNPGAGKGGGVYFGGRFGPGIANPLSGGDFRAPFPPPPPSSSGGFGGFGSAGAGGMPVRPSGATKGAGQHQHPQQQQPVPARRAKEADDPRFVGMSQGQVKKAKKKFAREQVENDRKGGRGGETRGGGAGGGGGGPSGPPAGRPIFVWPGQVTGPYVHAAGGGFLLFSDAPSEMRADEFDLIGEVCFHTG
jgi:hypothetical protein